MEDQQKRQRKEPLGFFSQLRSDIYDRFIVSMTANWYRSVLTRLPAGARVLDVGIGTASALLANKDVIVERDLTVVGVDYDADYVAAAEENVRTAELEARVSLVCASIHEYTPTFNALFDAIYFSGSFMIIPDKAKALKRCRELLLRPVTGKFYFTQTFENYACLGSLNNNVAKPMLKLCLTIDFGEVTYREEFEATLEEAESRLESYTVLVAGMARDQVLVVAT